jgi:hypothetical protein
MPHQDNIVVRRVDPSDVHPWLLNKHYAKRLCPISHAFASFEGQNMIGVVTYGTPVSSTLKDGVCGIDYAGCVLELNRLCCESRKNLASFIVGRSLSMLPRPSVVVSYADTGQGHVGFVYQATNFIYTGLSAAFKDPMVKGMEHKHHTTIGDEGRGHDSRIEFLRQKYGAENVYYVERDRKHRYVYFVGSKTDKKKLRSALTYPVQDYPKGETRRYDASAGAAGQTYFNI